MYLLCEKTMGKAPDGPKTKMSGKKIKLCVHDVLKKSCRTCSPSLYCPCKKLINLCMKCKVHKGRCGCQKSRSMCRIHGGWALCKCGSAMHHSRCTACHSGKMLCVHHKRLNNCPECLRAANESGVETPYLGVSSEWCACGMAKKHCAKCPGGASHLCTQCKLTIVRTKGSECSVCRRFSDGSAPLKKKEHAVKCLLDKAILDGILPPYTSHDKAIALGMDPIWFGATRPDWVWMLQDRWVVLEVDENQHAGANYSCERRRELQICNVAANMPMFFIRFNLDSFKTGSKTARVKSANESISMRHAAVLNAISSAVEETAPTGLNFVKLYFDCQCLKCNFIHETQYEDHESFLRTFQ